MRLIVQRFADVGDLNDILERLESLLGPLTGEPVALDGGITNRNFRAALRGRRVRDAAAGQGHRLLGIDREAERLATDAAAAARDRSRGGPLIDGCLVTEFIACEPVDRGTLAGGRRGDRQRAAQLPRLAAAASHQLPGSRAARGLRDDRRASAAEACRRATPDAMAAAERIAAALPLTPGARATTTCSPGNIIRARRDGA